MKITYNQGEGLYTADQALRVTALSYLKEALIQEQYEECAELVRAGSSHRTTPEACAGLMRGW